MALKISWSRFANDQVIAVYQYWNERNHSTAYSQRLEMEIQRQEKVLISFPETGVLTDDLIHRVLIVEHFKIFYRIDNQNLFIVAFFDSRQDPGKALFSK